MVWLTKINIVEEKLLLKGELLNGRQVASMLFQHYKIGDTDTTITEFQDLLKIFFEN